MLEESTKYEAPNYEARKNGTMPDEALKRMRQHGTRQQKTEQQVRGNKVRTNKATKGEAAKRMPL
jgi:hypothetical protein